MSEIKTYQEYSEKIQGNNEPVNSLLEDAKQRAAEISGRIFALSNISKVK